MDSARSLKVLLARPIPRHSNVAFPFPDANLNFTCHTARPDDVDTRCRDQIVHPSLHERYSLYTHAGLWAAHCSSSVPFPLNFSQVLPEDVASTIMMDGCWLSFSQRLRWPAPSTATATSEMELLGKLAKTQQLQRLPLTFDGLLRLDPELYRCSENTGESICIQHALGPTTSLAQLSHSNHSLTQLSHSTNHWHT